MDLHFVVGKGKGHRDVNYPALLRGKGATWRSLIRIGGTPAQSDDIEASGNPLLVQAYPD